METVEAQGESNHKGPKAKAAGREHTGRQRASQAAHKNKKRPPSESHKHKHNKPIPAACSADGRAMSVRST
jgi:hypothetical protein